jgi:hypothetical protein
VGDMLAADRAGAPSVPGLRSHSEEGAWVRVLAAAAGHWDPSAQVPVPICPYLPSATRAAVPVPYPTWHARRGMTGTGQHCPWAVLGSLRESISIRLWRIAFAAPELTIRFGVGGPVTRAWPSPTALGGVAATARAGAATGALGITATARRVRTTSASIARRRPHWASSSAGHRPPSPARPGRPRVIVFLLVVLVWRPSSSVAPVIVLSAVTLVVALVVAIPVVVVAITLPVLILVVLLLLGRRRIVLLRTAGARRVMALRRRSLGSRSSAILTPAGASVVLPVVRHDVN